MFLLATRNVRTSTASSSPRRGAIAPEERERLGRGADFASLPRAFGPPLVRGLIRQRPEDFVVAEQLAFRPTGEGEHLYLLVRKSDQNTRWVARQLARQLGLPYRSVGIAGMKDRHAVTTQWFSLHLPGRPDPDVSRLGREGIEIVDAIRHSGKLRTGALSGNRFRIVIRNIVGSREALRQRMEDFRSQAVPNYFGPQRFGHDGANLDLLSGDALGRDARAFGLSALRAALFNRWLMERITAGTWTERLEGEILYRSGERRYAHELQCGRADDAQPTGLLWGAGDNQATGAARLAENEFFAAYPDTCALIEQFQPRLMRRPLWLKPADLEFDLREDVLELRFSLGRGQFATVAIRELGEFFDSA